MNVITAFTLPFGIAGKKCRHPLPGLIILIVFCFPMSSYAQEVRNIEVGCGAGFRIYTAYLDINYRLGKKWQLLSQYSADNYEGIGLGAGVVFYPVPNLSVSPFIGGIYQRTLGTAFSYDLSGGVSTDFSTFRTKDANYFIPLCGIRLNLSNPTPGAHVLCSFIVRAGYKLHSVIAPEVKQVSGPAYAEKWNQINRHIQNSPVCSVGLLINFVKPSSIPEHKF